jgi:hypothetical protein
MQEGFEDAKIRVTQLCPFDALLRVPSQRLKGFHKDEPDMNAGGVLPWGCPFPPHSNFYIDIDCIDVNILCIKQTKLT